MCPTIQVIKLIRLFFISMFIVSCENNTQNQHLVDPNLPQKIGDTNVYIGTTLYTDNTDNFDTTYLDTIKIYVASIDSFRYSMNQLKYKELEFLDDKNDDITKVRITGNFQINDSSKYLSLYTSEYISSETKITLGAPDSIHFTDLITRPTENKIERRSFKGKLLK